VAGPPEADGAPLNHLASHAALYVYELRHFHHVLGHSDTLSHARKLYVPDDARPRLSMSPILKPPASDAGAAQHLSIDDAGALRHFNRTPRPYHRDGQQVHQDSGDGGYSGSTGSGDVVAEQGRHQSLHDAEREEGRGDSGQVSIAASESGTEGDDERPTFIKALPPATLRPRKGLKTGEKNEDALLTPSQLDDYGRRLPDGYFDASKQKKVSKEEEKAEEEKLLRRRLAEFARRSSEVGLMAVIIACVLCGKGVLHTAIQWRRELCSHVFIIATLILAYPFKLSIVDTRAQHNKLWQRFRVPASFDPATVLYPPLLPVLVALSVSPTNSAVVLPNIILGLASLPQRLFPRSSRLGGINAVHWLVSVIPLILSENTHLTFSSKVEKPYMLKAGPPYGLTSETLVSLYPLHHALLLPLSYLTTTSLLISELHLLSVALINLLLLAASPQTVILKACLWVGGVTVFVFCGPVLHWNVTLARVPRWKLRRPGHSAEERRSLVDAVSNLINIQRATGAFRSSTADSDADEDEPKTSIKEKTNSINNGYFILQTGDTIHRIALPTTKKPRREYGSESQGSKLKIPTFTANISVGPKSAVEPHRGLNGFLSETGRDEKARPRVRRNTLPAGQTSYSPRQQSTRRKARSKVLWCLQLTPDQAKRRKWLYAGYVYASVIVIALVFVRWYVEDKALYGQGPFLWATSYLFGQVPLLRTAVETLALQDWIQLPAPGADWSLALASLKAFATRPSLSTLWSNWRPGDGLNVESMRLAIGVANVRLLLIAYWALVLLVGLLAVFSLTAFVEVDTRRKVFHGVMVAMLLPSIFIDPCYCALAVGLVLAVFLLLEVIRAGQVPPLGHALSRFVAPYVDGRDLRGPVVVSHIFLLIGCAVPLWFSLASIQRSGGLPWIHWELTDNQREVAMVSGVICVGMGDAAASLIGRRYGRHKWIWVGGKSLEGSAAFALAVTVGLMFAKFWQVFGGWNDTVQSSLDGHMGRSGLARFLLVWVATLLKAVFCACGASFMEAVLTGANDNVVVPVALWLLVKGMRL
jgi:dolichol kinase